MTTMQIPWRLSTNFFHTELLAFHQFTPKRKRENLAQI